MKGTAQKMEPASYEWIGNIPNDWKIEKLKRVLISPLMYGTNEAAELEDKDLPRYIRITDFNGDGILREDTFKSLPFDKAEGYYLKEGDVLFARSGATVGKSFIFNNYKGRACFAGYLIKASSNLSKLLPDFLYYYTQSSAYDIWCSSIFTQATIQNISATKYAYLPIPLPSITIQHRIAAYLDKTCAAIDKAIEAKQRQLETLDALRKSIIHKAATRGLDDSVELKDSGVEWLGRIPKHWKVRRIKDIVALNSGDSITSDSITLSGNYPVFGGNGLRGFTTSYTHNGHYVLIGRQGALCGNIHYAEGKFWASEHAVVASTLTKHDTFWLGELLRVMNLNQYSNAAAQPGLAVEKIKFLRLPVPSYEEQNRIASFIRGKIVKNEELVSNLQKQISTLEQYRKSLIHECVTGKRRITEGNVQNEL